MDKIRQKKHFIGIDISNDKLDLALLQDAENGRFKDKAVTNDFKGFDSIPGWLEKQTIQLKDCVFCMEHTGTYGLLFFAWLSQMEIDYCVEPALKIKRSMGITRGKDDQVDAPGSQIMLLPTGQNFSHTVCLPVFCCRSNNCSLTETKWYEIVPL